MYFVCIEDLFVFMNVIKLVNWFCNVSLVLNHIFYYYILCISNLTINGYILEQIIQHLSLYHHSVSTNPPCNNFKEELTYPL